MKYSFITLAGLLPALFVMPIQAQGTGAPVLTTPGTATWSTELTAGGSRTVFTITGNTVLDWGQFNLASGNELVFDFVGGESVANLLGSNGTNIIAGDVTSNGNIAFYSPGANLLVAGNVVGKSVNLATLRPDPAVGSGGVFTLQGGPGAAGHLTVTGSVKATGGDVLLAGSSTQIFSGARITATGAVLMAAGTKVSVDSNREGSKLRAEGGEGFLFHMGETRAARIEVAAGREIQNGGRLDVGAKSQRIFLEIGSGGKILQTGSAIVVGGVTVNGKISREEQEFGGHDGDGAAALNDSFLRMPRVKRPDGSDVTKARTIVNSAPMSGSADGGRDRQKQGTQVAKNDKPASIYRSNSFFGVRAAETVAQKR